MSKYRERLRHLDEEAERLKILFAGLRARSAASVLTPAVDYLSARDVEGVDLTGLLERERFETAVRYQQLYPERSHGGARHKGSHTHSVRTAPSVCVCVCVCALTIPKSKENERARSNDKNRARRDRVNCGSADPLGE